MCQLKRLNAELSTDSEIQYIVEEFRVRIGYIWSLPLALNRIATAAHGKLCGVIISSIKVTGIYPCIL